MPDTNRPVRYRASGFTLIELLVAISIIALIIAMLLPALSAARASAQRLDCLVRIRQLGFLFQVYAQDHRGYLPALVNTNFSNSYAQASGQLADYVGYTATQGRDRGENLYHCPMQWQEDNATYWYFLYGYNYQLFNDPAAMQIDAHRSPSLTALLIERGTRYDSTYGYPWYAVRFNAAVMTNIQYKSYSQVAERHRSEGLNISYLDGRAAQFSDFRELPMAADSSFWSSH